MMLTVISITSLRHFARIHVKLIDKNKIVSLFNSLKDENYFVETIEDALDDICQLV